MACQSVRVDEPLLVAALMQSCVTVLVARASKLPARPVGQPALVGEIIAGLVLGPFLLERCSRDWPPRFSRAIPPTQLHVLSLAGSCR